MPVVNTANFVDRLRDITKRIDIRPSLQNASKRWHILYDALAVGSPHQVQEFYKYIKVYKQCPANDLLFMNMTVQLARASFFPTRSMFKQMLKFEKHMDGLILAEGFQGIYGSRGIEILCGYNDHLLRPYRKFKRHSETKSADREMKTARKKAKQIAALQEVRAKSRGSNVNSLINPLESLVPGEGPIPSKTQKVLDTTPNMIPLVPETQDILVKELSEVKKYCEILKAQMEEAEKKREEDDVANKLNEVVEKLISTASNSGDNDEEADVEMKEEEEEDDDDEADEVENDEDDENLQEEEKKDQSSLLEKTPEFDAQKLPDFQSCNITDEQKRAIMRILLGKTEEEISAEVPEKKIEEPSDDEEEIEKIDEKDVDAMEYEML
ncbi:hypothetical protein CRE_27483 [Caenorhabditis remanei]|uniref:Uncharacterized protein n=1 Tax=Caenorhabditis remanei TaxID=31234 RepID=E3LNU7_CAERE|nr:hypothetical protein CRE_27483 [Caenorhabditis remanei]